MCDINTLSQQVNDIRKGISEQNVFVELKNEVSAIKEQLSDPHIIKTQVAEITNHVSASSNQSSQISSKPTYKDALGSVSLKKDETYT